MGKNIVLLSDCSFPFGYAGSQKNRILMKALSDEGADVQVLILRPPQKKNKKKGKYGKVKYQYVSSFCIPQYKSLKIFNFCFIDQFILIIYKIIRRISIPIIEYLCLVKGIIQLVYLNKKSKIYVLLLYTLNFYDILLMRIASKLIKAPLIFFLVEDYSTFSFKSIFTRIRAKLYMKYSYYFIDGIVPISKYLYDKVLDFENKNNRSLYKLIIPVLFENREDFISDKYKKTKGKYYLFNGTAGYLDDAEFVISSFAKTNKKVRNETKLVLLIGNINPNQKKLLSDLAERYNIKKKVDIRGYVSEKKLKEFYKNALALLIPLPDTKKSKARFPQKIANFLLTGNPIITTNVGEMKYYFNDNENALVATSYDIEEYSEKMNYIFDYPEHATKIGRKGRELALKYFDHSKYAKLLLEYIDNIISRS